MLLDAAARRCASCKRLDLAWILVRRAAGVDQREGVIGRVFAYSAAIGGDPVLQLADPHRGPRLDAGPGVRPTMGFLDYYKQFEGMPDEEVNARLREQAEPSAGARRWRVVEPLDLSQTTWPEYPHPDVVNAITYAARRGLHRYLDRSAAELRSELAHRHGRARGARGRRRRRRAAAQLGGLRAHGPAAATSSSRRGRPTACTP